MLTSEFSERRTAALRTRPSVRMALAAIVGGVALTGCGGADYRSTVRGECLPESAQVVGTREADPPTVDCDEPHRYEVYAVTEVAGPRNYPGEEVVDEMAQHACYLEFEANVGYRAERMPSDVKVLYLQPTASSWNGEGDREVECLLVFDDDRTGRVIPARPIPTTTTTTTAPEATT